MLDEIGVKDVGDLIAVIPKRLRLTKPLGIPEALSAEGDLRREVESTLSKNSSAKDYLNFLGAGCWQHYVPAICDAIGQRQEFLTAYEGDTYSDLGKWQALFEFQSLLGGLLNMDVVSFPTYDGASAAGYAIRMANRMTRRGEVLVPENLSRERLSIFGNMSNDTNFVSVAFDRKTGSMDLADLKRKVSKKTSAVYFENPSFFGTIENHGEEISQVAHSSGAKIVVSVDPISLGVLKPPADYGADIACGELQPLGLHMQYGGGLGGFIASHDDEKTVAEYSTWLVSITKTANEGEYGFELSTPERTHYFQREKGKDFTGTGTGLFGIVAGVYLALMGPQGMKAVGETIMERSHYAAKKLSSVEGVKLQFGPYFFKEFVLNLSKTGRSVDAINRALLKRRIFGGVDLGRDFKELSGCSMYSTTEVHTKEDIDRLAEALKESVRQ
jgi:glycine dehydrogenase subunit 1